MTDLEGERLNDGRYYVSDIEDINLDIKGNTPTSGYVTIKDGLIEDYYLEFDSYVVISGEDGKVQSKKESEITKKYTSYKTGKISEVSIIYFNPEKNIFCTENEYTNNLDKLGKTGCLKWYAIENSDENKSTVNVILDHNTTGISYFNYSNKNVTYHYTLYLKDDSKTWRNGLNPRLISMNEILSVIGNTTFDITKEMSDHVLNLETQTTSAPSTYTGIYGWLYDNLYQSKSKYKSPNEYNEHFEQNGNYIWGYWTSDSTAEDPNQIWYVLRDGFIYTTPCTKFSGTGIRPVITINKEFSIN